MSEKHSPELENLACILAVAKREEDEAKSRRIDIEEQIARLISTPENGSKTVQAGAGLKVTVKRALSYKADINAIRALNLEESPVKLVPAKWEFDQNKYESIILDNPKLANELSNHVTVTPRKVSVSLKIN